MISFIQNLLIKLLYPGSITRLPADRKVVYLSFDDGPHPEITPVVLNLLSKYQAKATFFLIGSRVEKYYDIYQRILEQGHVAGNHTMNHEKGWVTSTEAYVKSVESTASLVDSGYFRPPYGKCTRKQYNQLKSKFRFVYWDVLAEDWNRKLSGEQCYKKVIKNCKNGSVVVLHDSEKAWPRLQIALPLILDSLAEKGFVFESLPVKPLSLQQAGV
jgi:peptidoglycan/xylan/chitin deacetylase (PgdA/CDA1 family)